MVIRDSSGKLPELGCRCPGGSGPGLPSADLQGPPGGEGEWLDASARGLLVMLSSSSGPLGGRLFTSQQFTLPWERTCLNF